MPVVLTNAGRALIVQRLLGSGANPRYVAWGTGSAAATNSDTTLAAETGTRSTGTVSAATFTSANDTLQVTATRIAVARTNLITNGGAEVNLAGWSTSSPPYWINSAGVLTRDTTTSMFGAASFNLQVASSQYNGVAYSLGALPAGQLYCGSLWLKGTSTPSSLQLTLGDSGAGVTYTSLLINPTSTFTRYSVSWTSTGNNAYLLLRNTVAASSFNINFDGVQLETGMTPTSYIDTNTGSVSVVDAISELGLLTAATGGTLFIRSSFSPLALGVGDTMAITFKLTFQ